MRERDQSLYAQLSKEYQPNFMQSLDGRTTLGRVVRERFERIVEELGGTSNLTSITLSLVRRFLWLEIFVESIESRVAAGEQVELGAWTQAINSWLGLSRALGLERRPKRLPSVQEYLKRSNGREAAA